MEGGGPLGGREGGAAAAAARMRRPLLPEGCRRVSREDQVAVGVRPEADRSWVHHDSAGGPRGGLQHDAEVHQVVGDARAGDGP